MMRYFLILLLSIGLFNLNTTAQERIDGVFNVFKEKEHFAITTDYGEITGVIDLIYNANEEPYMSRVTIESDNYNALADVCKKLLSRQIEQGGEIIDGEDLPRKRFLFLIENHQSIRVVAKSESYYWTLKGTGALKKESVGNEIYTLIIEGEDVSRKTDE